MNTGLVLDDIKELFQFLRRLIVFWLLLNSPYVLELHAEIVTAEIIQCFIFALKQSQNRE